MAICVPSEDSGDFASPHGTPFPGSEAPEGSCSPTACLPETQAETGAPVAQSPWNHENAEPFHFWGGLQTSDDSSTVLPSDWPLDQQGLPALPSKGANAGWCGYCSPLPMPQRPNPNGGDSPGHQSGRTKRRFCTSFPEVQHCRRGSSCAFAHAREEIRAPLLDMAEEQQEASAMTDDFFMYKYKMLWCPIGVQHEWHTCVYAHNYQDARRPTSIGYGARLCPYWSKKDTGAEYSERCPLGLRCPYAHGAKEQLYHPEYFKTVICRDLRGKACPRQGLCAFFHNKGERRSVPAREDIDYCQPLPEDALADDWIEEFLTPPFLPEVKYNEDGMIQVDGNSQMCMNSYAGVQAAQSGYGMQQPYVFLVQQPMGNQMCAQMASPMGDHMDMTGANWVFVPPVVPP